MKLGTSPSLELAKKLIGDFYYRPSSDITLFHVGALHWGVQAGGKIMDSVELVKKGKRYIFRTKEN